MPAFFPTAAAFRAWLDAHAATEPELLVGFHKLGSGLPSLTWPESVDEALCHGWIDGRRTRLDAQSYQIRFTPRRPASIWSAVNLARVLVLQAGGRMCPAGLAAYERRSESRSKIYAYEQPAAVALDPADEARFRAQVAAWDFFQSQPPGYRRLALHRITSAKRPGTRQSRLDQLIAASQNARRLL